MPDVELNGAIYTFLLFDVADEIDIDRLRGLLSLSREDSAHPVRRPAPDYVRFRQTPAIEPLSATECPADASRAALRYYGYGVVSLILETPFATHWAGLIGLAARAMTQPRFEERIETLVRSRLERAAGALVKPYARLLSEDYYVIQLQPVRERGELLDAAELLRRHGAEIAQVTRGETPPLSEEERNEILNARISYYPHDLVVAGWTGALVYDTEEGAAPSLDLLEYANSQLLEFRHYDAVLTERLGEMYDRLAKPRGFIGRWRLGREAERFNAILLEVRELTERVDNSIKFLSDMFSARLYRLAAERVGVPDYRRLVDEKLRTAAELYRFMVDQYNHSRAFVLELMVVIILIIDLFYLFRGKAG